MKTKSLFIAVVVMFSAVVATFGKEEPSKIRLAVVPVKGTEVFKVIYKGETAGKVKLNIYNKSGVVIFSEIINSLDGFIRPLNFGGLENGEYTVELSDASGRKVEKISYFPEATSSVKNVHVAKITEEGKYLVAVANDGNASVTINIFDSNDVLLHSEVKEVKGNFAQVYVIKNQRGGLTFQVSNGSGETRVVKF